MDDEKYKQPQPNAADMIFSEEQEQAEEAEEGVLGEGGELE